jgi:hypothetical protein
VDAARWYRAVDEWEVLAHDEGVAANLEAAQAIQKRTASLLSRFSHRRFTRTPSPVGEPPAEISGRLILSIRARHDGDDALVGPTALASSKNGPYGRFLELGGAHVAHNAPEMVWHTDGKEYRATFLEKFGRPYLKPATRDAIDSGEIHDIYWRRWLWAQEAVTN